MSQASMSHDAVIQVTHVNHVAILTLNRPRALNALTHEMVLQLHQILDDVESNDATRAVMFRGAGDKAFCAGGDVIAIAQSIQESSPLARDFFIDEYTLDMRIHGFGKPCVAFMDGIVMGGGMGLAQGCDLRLVGPRTKMAMPETRIGLIPDVGATHFFQRMPAPLAHYLALTGVTIGASDAIFAGLADAHAREHLSQSLEHDLQSLIWPSDRMQDLGALQAHLCAESPCRIDQSNLLPQCEAIFAHFGPNHGPGRIAASLAEDPCDWAQSTLTLLKSRSPLMLALCGVALRQGRSMDRQACFEQEFGFVQLAIARGEVSEGVRAFLIDKDQQPHWSVASIDELSDPIIESACHEAQALSRGFNR